MTAQLRLNVFGSPELVQGASAVRFRTRKHLAVLLYLHFEGRTRPVPRDRLVDLLWPDVSASQGRHSLSQALLAIRSHLGPDAVTGGREEDVQLLMDLPSDVAAPTLGEPLQGLEDCGSAEFSHWVDGVRVRLRDQSRAVLRTALQAARAGGDAAATRRVATTLYAVDPLCAEAVYALAERALLERDTVGAVRILKEHVARARAELGSNPNPEIARLLRRLERGERPAVAGPHDERVKPHPFVGREAELGRLEGVANRVVDGARSAYETCLISGPPGIGKTSLIRRFATSLQARAWPVFVVSCQEIGQGIPYAAVAELITALARDPAAGGTAPLWLSEASRVAPGLRALYPGVPDAPDAPTESIRLRVAEAVVHMIEAVADDGPVLLALDDLQFVDPASQDVLFLVTRALAGSGVSALILAGSRGGEVSGAGNTGGLTWPTTIALQPLDQSLALGLLRDLSAEGEGTNAHIRETIARLAQGNPYHLEMLLADWRMHHANSLVAAASAAEASAVSWAPPDDLRAAFARQYGGLSSDAQHVLQVLAVAGKALAPRDVASLLGLAAGVSERVVLEMLDRGVGRVEEGKLSFKNELHRTYVYHAMGNDRRTYHHAQFAQRLAEAPDRHELQLMLELVHHAIGAGLESQAMETGLEAAEAAIARGAPLEAERVLTRLLHAYAVPATSRLRLLLGQALVSAAQYQNGLAALAEWRTDGASPTDRALGALLRAEAMHRSRLGTEEAIVAAAREAIELAQQARATPSLIRANYIRAEISIDAADPAGRAEAGALAAQVAASDTTPECLALANITLGQIALQEGALARGVEYLKAAVPTFESLSLLVELRRALSLMGLCYRGMGQVVDAIRVFRETVTLSERSGHLGSIIHGSMILANLYHDLAWFDAAVETYRRVLHPLESMSSPRAWVEAYCDLARLASVLGSMQEAELAVTRCEDGARRSGLWRHGVTARMARAELHLCTGRPELAWPLLEEAGRVTGDRGHLLPDAGRYQRLQRHLAWATRGELVTTPVESHSVIDGLELRLFDEAVQGTPGAPVLAQAVAMGLLGPLARLVATGVQHPAVPRRLDGESAAQHVARVYPHAQRAAVPSAVGLS